MKLKLGELTSNPFKKHISNGKLNQDRIDILKESIDHGTLPEHFTVREHNGKYELTSGHHRASALKSVKGSNYTVEVNTVDFSDEQMLIDMVRENMTQRDTDYHDTRESIVLARHWLTSGSSDVEQFNNAVKGKKDFQPIKQPGSYRSIANFLSKNGKTVHYSTVKNYLDVHNKLHPELLEKIRKVKNVKDKSEDDVTVSQALALSMIPKNEQIALWKIMQNEEGRPHQYLSKYKQAPDTIKQKVRNGEIRLTDIEFETDKDELKDKADKRPKTIFIPNFERRMKDLNKNIGLLEKQVVIFSKVFHSKDFDTRYSTLKPKQQKDFNTLILNIKGRIEQCYNEINFYVEKLNGNIIEIGGEKNDNNNEVE